MCPAALQCHADNAPPCLCSSVTPDRLDLVAFVTLPEPKPDLSVAGTLPAGSVLALVVPVQRCLSSLLAAEKEGRDSQTLAPLTHSTVSECPREDQSGSDECWFTKEGLTTTRAITLPLNMPNTSTKALPSICALARKV